MYLTSIEIKELHSIRPLRWQVPQDKAPGRHVILAPNGLRKSSLLRATALGIGGPKKFDSLRLSVQDRIRRGPRSCDVKLRRRG